MWQVAAGTRYASGSNGERGTDHPKNHRWSCRTVDAGRIVRAARYSYAGLRSAVMGEAAFRQELILAALLTPAAIWLGENGVERP